MKKKCSTVSNLKITSQRDDLLISLSFSCKIHHWPLINSILISVKQAYLWSCYMWSGAKGPVIVPQLLQNIEMRIVNVYSINAGSRVHTYSHIVSTVNCWCFQHAACCSLCEAVAQGLVYLQSCCLQLSPAAKLNRFLFLVVTWGWPVNAIDPKLLQRQERTIKNANKQPSPWSEWLHETWNKTNIITSPILSLI